jgi:hypothetical protein
MLDLRIVLAASLAAFMFLLAGIGVFAALRVNHTSPVAFVKDGSLPHEPVRLRQSQTPWTLVETPATVRVPAAPPPPEITGAIESLIPPPLAAVPLSIEDLLVSPPPAAAARDEPELSTATIPRADEVAAPVSPHKPGVKHVRSPREIAAAKRRQAAKARARAARSIEPAPANPPFFLFNPQPSVAR